MEDDFYGDDQEDESLQQEWKAREAQFKTLGYRDGVTAGKDQTLQQGFNSGFKVSIQAGYDWGRARGVASALLTLGAHVNLVTRPGAETEVAQVAADVAAISTEGALRHFSAAISIHQANEHAKSSAEKGTGAQDFSDHVSSEDLPTEVGVSSLDKFVASSDEKEGQTKGRLVLEGTLGDGTSLVRDTAQQVVSTELLRTLESRVWSLISAGPS